MTIQPDSWIRQMAHEHGMIEPFVEKQVSSHVISYGVSSYGYDIRVADEYKIFTNVFSAIVDPKQFDPKSMVDFKGDVCIIPPNSFVLARTIEYFRIPRNVLTLCVGKCLTGDTRIVDEETGDYIPLKDFVSRQRAHTLALDGWRLRQGQVTAHINNGIRPVYELRTRAGLHVKATATHPFRTLMGWTPLAELHSGDRIAVARMCPVFGQEEWPEHEAILLGLMLADGQCHTPGHSPRYTTGDPRLAEVFTEAARAFGCDVSPVGHVGYNLVNRHGHGGVAEKNRAYVWLEQLGCNVQSRRKSVPSIVFKAKRERVAAFLRALFSGDGSAYHTKQGVYLEYSSTSQQLAEDVRHLLLRFGVFALIRSKSLATGGAAYRVQITDRTMIQRFAQEIGFVSGSRKQQALNELLDNIAVQPRHKSNSDSLPSDTWQLMRERVYANGQTLAAVGIRSTHPQQSLPYTLAQHVAQAMSDEEFAALVEADVVWDVVESIEPAGEEVVYDLTVPGVHNFLANDIIVHNSTYARCFRGDTRIALVDGTAPTLEKMAHRAETGEMFWGYSIGENGRLIVALLDAPRYVGRDKLVEVALDNGQTINCTPDHRFMLRDGRWLAAEELQPNASLMPLYRSIQRGYEMVYQPLNGHLYPTHRLADEWNVRQGVYADQSGTHRHHVDFDRLNNNPWNLVRLPASQHIRLHNAENYGTEFEPDEHGAAIREALERLSRDPAWAAEYAQLQSERASRFWHEEEYAEIRARLLEQRRHPSEQTRQAHREATLRRYQDMAERLRHSELMKTAWTHSSADRRAQQAEIARGLNLRAEITAEVVRDALDQAGSMRGAARLLNCDRTVFRRYPEVIRVFRGQTAPDNHKVTAVRALAGEHDVFCLTVPEAGNFALESGVFVSNCGLIVNVTPFEPCFSDDTEILTPAGWASLKEIQIGDCVMGMSREGFAEYQPVIAKQERNYAGEMLHFGGRSIDLLVTPDHKLFVNRRTNGRPTRKGLEKTGWHTTEASQVFGAHNFEMSRKISWQGDDPGETLMVNGVRYPTQPFLKFLGLWLGDGSAYIPQKDGKNSGYIVQIAAFNQKRAYVKEVLDDLGIHYNEMREGFRFYSKSLHDYLQPYKLAPNKHVPREWLNLRPEFIRLILEGLLTADGNMLTKTITTVSPQLADDIQVMAFLSGQSAIVRKAAPEKHTRTVKGHVVHSNYDVYKIRLTSGQLTPKIGPECHERVPYNGKVYDVTVPNHLIFVRRNGKAVWSGNCWEGFVTLEISNTTPLPAKVYSNEGIAQVLFFVADQECETSYKDRKGKYDKQTGVVPAKIIK